MRRLSVFAALVFCAFAASAQNVPWERISTSDTIRPVPATRGARLPFVTFPDGSKMTSAAGFSDTTKYVEWADSAATAGWVTREKFRLDTTYKAAQLLLRVLYSDTGTTAGKIPRVWYVWNQIQDSLAEYLLRSDSGVVYASFPQFRDSLANARSRYVWKRDSGIVYASFPQFRDTTASARSRYVWKPDSGVVYMSWPQGRDSLASARSRYVWKRDSGIVYASYSQFRDSLAAHWGQLSLRVLYSDTGTTAAKIPKNWYLYDQIRDSLAEYMLRANPVSTGLATFDSLKVNGKIKNGFIIGNGTVDANYALSILDVSYGNMKWGSGTYNGGLSWSSTGSGSVTMGAVSNHALILQGNNFNVAILDKADGRGRFTLGSTAGTGAGKLYAGDSLYIGTTLFVDASRNVSGANGFFSGTGGYGYTSMSSGTFGINGILAIGTNNPTNVASAGADDLTIQGSGNTGITIYTPATNTAEIDFARPSYSQWARINYNHSTDLMSFFTANGTRFLIDAANGGSRVTVGTSAGTGDGLLYAGDSLYIGTTLALDASRNASLGTISSGAITSTGTVKSTYRGTTAGVFLSDIATAGTPSNMFFQAQNSAGTNTPDFRAWIERDAAHILQFVGRSGAVTETPIMTFNLNTFGVGIGNTVGSATAQLAVKGTNNKANILELYRSGSAVAVASADTNGRIGIKTSSPGYSLEIQGGATATGGLLIQNGGGAPDFQTKGNQGNVAVRISESGATDPGILELLEEGNTKVYLFAGGNSYFNGGKLGIKTTSPQSDLDFAGNLEVGTGYNSGLHVAKFSKFNGDSVATVDTTGLGTFTTLSVVQGQNSTINPFIIKRHGGGAAVVIDTTGSLYGYYVGTNTWDLFSGSTGSYFTARDGAGAAKATIDGRSTSQYRLTLTSPSSATAVATVDTNGVPDFPNALVSGVIVGDSVRVAVPGLTTATGDAVVCYRMAASAAPDTLPSFRINVAGYITLTGKHGYTVKAFVGRK